MLECKDCCLYYTDACRYGSYALEHNMSLKCDDFIVEHNNAYQQGRADAIDEYKQSEEYIKECVQRYLKGRADIQSEIMDEVAMLNETKMTAGDLKCFAYRIKAIAEQKGAEQK